MNLLEYFKSTRLRTQLITIFLLITLIPIIAIAFLSYYYTENIFIGRTITNLKDIIEREESEINLFFSEKIDDAKKIAQYVANNPNISQENLKFITESLGFSNYTINTVDKFIAPNSAIKNKDLTKEIHFFFDEKTQTLQSFITEPIYKDGKKWGEIALEITHEDLKKWFTSINKFVSLGKSFEFIIGIINDGKLYLLVTPRNGYSKDDTFPILQAAIHNVTTSGITSDFRGHKVIAISKNLSFINGGIVGKINYDEVLKPLNLMKFMFFSAAIAVAGLVILTAPNIAAYIVNPIKSLIQKTKKMAAGNLSQRIEIKSQNELGLLGQSFNEMAEKLENHVNNLDKIVTIRTKELSETIEDLKSTQDRLIAQEKLASLGAMTAGVAHEIKNPLNFVNNFSYLSLDLLPTIENYIQRKESEPKDNKEALESLETMKSNLLQICEQGKRADSIVKRMLAHSRTQNGTFTETDINVLIQETVNLSFHTMRAQHPESHVKIEFNLDPAVKKLTVVSEDINRVILNLIHNSFYSVIAKKKLDANFFPQITISTKAFINEIEIRVKDNGIGIPDDKKQNIFAPFFTTKPSGEGTGLGLSLSFNIITQEHGGKMEFESLEGEFAEFIIKLPIKERAYVS